MIIKRFIIEVFDIENNKISLYQLNQSSDKDSYLMEVNMKKRNVIYSSNIIV